MRSPDAGEEQPAVPDSEYPEDLLELKRRLEARGISVRLPKLGDPWVEPKPLPIDANEMSAFVVWLRRRGEL
jgi:hypothetical protein